MPPPLGPNARAVLQRAERAISTRDPQSVRADHRDLIGVKGTPAPLLYRLGILEAEAGRADLATSLIEAARVRAPGDLNIVVNLAQISLATDDAARAIALLAELPAEIRRNPAVARIDGIARASIGDHEAAIPRLETAQRAAPGDPVLLNNLGVCLRALGRTREAAAAFERIRAPGVEVRVNLSGLLLQLDQAERARDILADGLKEAPDSAALHRQMALVARALLQPALAVRAARTAILLEPDVAAHAGVVADLAENRADLARAGSWVDRALLIDPRTTFLRQLRLRITRRLRNPEGTVVLAERWLSEETEPARRHPLLFELGQALDALKRTGEAYDSFVAANVAQREATPALIGNPDRVLKQIQGLDGLLNRGWRPKPEGAGQSSRGRDAPVFLVGFPRSGTTLLDQVLDAHPKVAVIEERPLIPEIIARLAEFGKHYPEGLEHLSTSEVASLRDHYLSARDRLIEPMPGQIVIDKMPLNIAHVVLIKLVFPEARFILSLRDPCDVVLSCFMQAFQLNNWMAALLSLEGAAELYSQVFRHWELACEALHLPHVRIRYEDMVADLEAAVTPVLMFLGLDWRPDMARFHEHARTRSRLATPSAGQVTRPIYTDALARWRRYAEIEGAPMAVVADRLVEERRRYGYLEVPDTSLNGSDG
jgi:tetratricopeptide (TPR) repeat protein